MCRGASVSLPPPPQPQPSLALPLICFLPCASVCLSVLPLFWIKVFGPPAHFTHRGLFLFWRLSCLTPWSTPLFLPSSTSCSQGTLVKGASEGRESDLEHQQAPCGWVGRGNASHIPLLPSEASKIPPVTSDPFEVRTPLNHPSGMLTCHNSTSPPLLPSTSYVISQGYLHLLECFGPPPASGKCHSCRETWTLCASLYHLPTSKCKGKLQK